MNQILLAFFLLTATAFTSCGQQNQPAFPSQLQTTKTSRHLRMAGTRVFGVFPTGYQSVPQLARFQKTDDLYMQAVESHTNSFAQGKAGFSRAAIEAKGAQVDTWQTTRVNGYDGIYVAGPSKHPGETKLMLAFGDDSFLVLVLGVAKTADKPGLKELKGIMQTIYYDATLQTDPLELANASFDPDITHFRYAQTMSNLIEYAENGPADSQNPTANAIWLMSLPKTSDVTDEQLIASVLKGYERKDMSLDDPRVTRTIIAGCPARVVATTTHVQDKKGCLYLALLQGPDSGVLFTGTAYNAPDKYLPLFRQTAETLKIKQNAATAR